MKFVLLVAITLFVSTAAVNNGNIYKEHKLMSNPADPRPPTKAEETTVAGHIGEAYDYRSDNGNISPIRYILTPQGGYQTFQERIQQIQNLLNMVKSAGNSDSGYGISVDDNKPGNTSDAKVINSSDHMLSTRAVNSNVTGDVSNPHKLPTTSFHTSYQDNYGTPSTVRYILAPQFGYQSNVTGDVSKPHKLQTTSFHTSYQDNYGTPSTVHYILAPQFRYQFQTTGDDDKSSSYPLFSNSITLNDNILSTNISESTFSNKTMERQQAPLIQYETLLNSIEENSNTTDFKQSKISEKEILNTTEVLEENSLMPLGSVDGKPERNIQSLTDHSPTSFNQLVPFWLAYHPPMITNYIPGSHVVLNPLIYPIVSSYHML